MLTPTVLMRFLDDNLFAGPQELHHPDPGGADVDADTTRPPEAATASAKAHPEPGGTTRTAEARTAETRTTPSLQPNRVRRSRRRGVTSKMERWKPTGESHVDFEPTELADSFLNELMTKSKNHRNFITYVAGHDRDAQQYRVRVNCKFNPEDSYVKMPTAMEGYAKTTMIKIRGEPH